LSAPSLSTYAVFVVTCLALLAIPGPAVLSIVSRSIDPGRPAGLLSALGVTTGTLVHIAAAAIGLAQPEDDRCRGALAKPCDLSCDPSGDPARVRPGCPPVMAANRGNGASRLLRKPWGPFSL